MRVCEKLDLLNNFTSPIDCPRIYHSPELKGSPKPLCIRNLNTRPKGSMADRKMSLDMLRHFCSWID